MLHAVIRGFTCGCIGLGVPHLINRVLRLLTSKIGREDHDGSPSKSVQVEKRLSGFAHETCRAVKPRYR